MSLQKFNAVKKELLGLGVVLPKKGNNLVDLQQLLEATSLLISIGLTVDGSTREQILETHTEVLALLATDQETIPSTENKTIVIGKPSNLALKTFSYKWDKKLLQSFKPYERLGLRLTKYGTTADACNRTFSGSTESKSTLAPHVDPCAYSLLPKIDKRDLSTQSEVKKVKCLPTQGHNSTGYCPSGRKKDVNSNGDPVTRSLPKKTKSKISWGTRNVDTGSTTSLPSRYLPENVQYQSRWYKDPVNGRKYTLRIEKDLVVQYWDNGALGYRMKAVWNSDLSGDYHLVPSGYRRQSSNLSITTFEENVFLLFPQQGKTNATKEQRQVMLSPRGLPADVRAISSNTQRNYENRQKRNQRNKQKALERKGIINLSRKA